MFKRGVACLVVLAVASIANASVIVTLTPSASSNAMNQPMVYDPGEQVRMDVSFNQTPGGATQLLRLIQLDFGSSNAALSFAANPDVDGNSLSPDFTFDLASFPQDAGFYFLASELPVPAAAFTGPGARPDRQIALPASGSVHLGFVNVTLPMLAGDYLVNAITATNPNDPNLGGIFSWGFGTPTDPIIELRPGEGIQGGTKTLTVREVAIPEPATLAFLACGAIAMLRRRRSA